MEPRLCEVCKKRSARYVCQECGRNVCERCLEPHTWLCTECYESIKGEAPRQETEEKASVNSSFMKAFILGFFLIFIGTVILMIAALIHGLQDSFGLVVFIGPIPIVLGAGSHPFLAITLAVILTVLGIALFIILRTKK